MKWEAEKEKGRVVSLILEEEKDLKAQYRIQAESELEARRVAESNIERYLAQINDLRDRISTLQDELETQGEELKIVQEQRSKWKEGTAEIKAQLNSEITGLSTELQKTKDQTQQLENMVHILEKNNESLVDSNEALRQDNFVFHHKIEQTDKMINIVAMKANELCVKATRIGGSARKYEMYLDELSSFVKLVANRGVAFE